MATGTDIYTIEVIDRVSGPANRAAAAARNLQRRIISTNAALEAGDFAAAGAARAAERMAASALRAANAEAKLAGALGGVKRSGFGTGVVISALGNALGNLAARGISAAVDGLFSLGRSLSETVDLASRSRVALGNLYGGVAEGKAVQKSAIELSNRYGLELQTVLDTMAQFKGAGFSTSAGEDLIKLGADMQALSTGGKDSAMQLESVFRALRKIKSQSFLQGDELNMLSEAGVSVDKIYGVLQYRLGKTREEIMKMQSARKLPANLVISAVAEATLAGRAERFGQLGEQFADSTTVGAKNRIEANLKNALFGAAQDAEPALVKGLNAILGGVLNIDGKGIQDALTNALVKVGQELENLGPKIPGFVASLEKVATVLSDISKAVMPMLDVLGFVGGGIGKVLGAIPGNIAFDLSDTVANAEARRARRQADSEGAIDLFGRVATQASFNDFGGPLNDLAFSAAKETTDGQVDATLAAPSAGIRTQVVEAAAAVAAGTPGAGKKVDVGAVNVNINLSGTGDPYQAADSIRQWADTEFGATLERQLEGTGD